MLGAQQSPPLTRNQRLDLLPLNSQHKRLLVGSGLGWALDAMDVGLISFVMAALIKHWGLTHGQTSVLASAGFVGMAIGATFGGLLADKWGRRNVFALTLLVYGLATGASALAGGLAVLIVLRFIVGLGLGAELPVASTLVSEFAPLRHRGRHDEAEAAVQQFEKASTTIPDTPAIATEDPADQADSIFAPNMRRRTFGLWTVWFCINLSYYGAFIWIPSLLVADGFSLVKSFQFTLIITLAQFPGYALAAWLIEIWGRRTTLAVFLLGSAGSAALYGFADTTAFIIAAGCCLSFFNLGAWGALYAISPELYPSQIRGTGTGSAAGFGRIASIIAPLIVPPIVAAAGTPALFALFGAAFLAAAIAAFTLPEQRGKALV
ncbi:Putative niacin/nicotinamide transporter NaiP [Corynebacterium diphtheriae subsp. lausannense]|nr:Putative niacin/nicotinamide transporter NaiP [Corynebacterium diphtheriae subsp. lausannense]